MRALLSLAGRFLLALPEASYIVNGPLEDARGVSAGPGNVMEDFGDNRAGL